MLLPYSTTSYVGVLSVLCIFLLSKVVVVVVEGRGEGGGPCRVQNIDTLWVAPALGNLTHYAATLQINILFASDSTEEDRATLNLGSSLRVWTSPRNDDDGNENNKIELSFEHFDQTQSNNEMSMIVQVLVPYQVPSIEMSVEKDGNPNYCYSIGPVLLDKQPCIDVHSARISNAAVDPAADAAAVNPTIADTRSSSSTTPKEYQLTVTLRPTETKLARTNQRLPPTDNIGWRLSTDSENIQTYTLLPKEKKTGNSVTLTFEGSVQSPYIQDGLSISAYDKTQHDSKPWSCGNYFYAELLDDEEDNGSENCIQQQSAAGLTQSASSVSSLSYHSATAKGLVVVVSASTALASLLGY